MENSKIYRITERFHTEGKLNYSTFIIECQFLTVQRKMFKKPIVKVDWYPINKHGHVLDDSTLPNYFSGDLSPITFDSLTQAKSFLNELNRPKVKYHDLITF